MSLEGVLTYMVIRRSELTLKPLKLRRNEIVFHENLLRLEVWKDLCFCITRLIGIVGDLCESILSFMMILNGLSCWDLYL